MVRSRGNISWQWSRENMARQWGLSQGIALSMKLQSKTKDVKLVP